MLVQVDRGQVTDPERHLQAGQARGKLVITVTDAGYAAASPWLALRRVSA